MVIQSPNQMNNRLYKKYLRNPTMDRQLIDKSYKSKLRNSFFADSKTYDLYYDNKLNNVHSKGAVII